MINLDISPKTNHKKGTIPGLIALHRIEVIGLL